MDIEWIGSPNFTTGRQNVPIDKVVIHWMDGNLVGTDKVFQDTTRNTSAHYGIEDGIVHQYVAEKDTAYHAGDWNMNLRSIGIEHSAQPGRDASENTLKTSAVLVLAICNRYGIPIDKDHIIRHSDVVPTQCPGTINVSSLINKVIQLKGGNNVLTTKEDLDQLYDEVLFRARDNGEGEDVYLGKEYSSVNKQLLSSDERKRVRQGIADTYNAVASLRSQADTYATQIASLPTQEQLKAIQDKLDKMTADYQALVKNQTPVLDKTTPSGKSFRTLGQAIVGLYGFGLTLLADPTVHSFIAVHPKLVALPVIGATVTAIVTYIQNKLEEKK